jgi:hypothetical protein
LEVHSTIALLTILPRWRLSENSTTRFELWKMESGHAFFAVNNESARRLLQPDARLVWSVEAASWHEARARMHEYLGWDPYRPVRPSAKERSATE